MLVNNLKKQAVVEEERLQFIREIRQHRPLFLEDHDHLIRWILSLSIEGKKGLPVSNFFLGPISQYTTFSTNGSSVENAIDHDVVDNIRRVSNNPNALQLHMRPTEDSSNKVNEDSQFDEPLYLTTLPPSDNSKDNADQTAPPAKRTRLEVSMNDLRETFTCSICLNLMHNPTALPCGHSGCLRCFKRTFFGVNSYKKCPICKAPISANLKADQMVVNIVLRDTIKLLFHSKDNNSMPCELKDNNVFSNEAQTVIDIPKILKIMCQEFGFSACHDENSDMHELNIDTYLIVLGKGGTEVEDDLNWTDSNDEKLWMRNYSLSSDELACHVKRECVLQHHAAAYASTVCKERIALCQQLKSQNRVVKETLSSLPLPLMREILTGMNSIQSSFTANASGLFETFVRDFHAGHLFPLPQETDCALSFFLPNHKLSQCFRRAKKRFDTLSKDDMEDDNSGEVYKMLRTKCWEDLVLPLLKSTYKNANVLKISDLPSIRLVTVNDALIACASRYPSPIQVFGYGYMGGIRGLLIDGIQKVLEQVHPKFCIDEIAISVLHDIMISAGVDILRAAMFRSKLVNTGKFDKVSIGTISIDGIEQWKGEVYVGRDDVHDSIDRTLTVRLLTDSMILDAMQDRLCGEVAKHASREANTATNRLHGNPPSINSSREIASKYFRDIGVVLSPNMLLFALQSLPEFNHTVHMTIEALVSLTMILEYICAEILELAGNACRDNEDICINSRHIYLAIRLDVELDAIFPGCIRQSGTNPGYLPFEVMDNVPANLQEEVRKTKVKLDNLMDSMFKPNIASLRLFASPFDGGIVAASSHDSSEPRELRRFTLFEELTKVPFATNPQYENHYFRRLQSMDTMTSEQKQQYEELWSSKAGQWLLRGEDVYDAVRTAMPVFDTEEMYGLFQYVHDITNIGDPSSFHVSNETCELLGCLVENYLIRTIVTGDSL